MVLGLVRGALLFCVQGFEFFQYLLRRWDGVGPVRLWLRARGGLSITGLLRVCARQVAGTGAEPGAEPGLRHRIRRRGLNALDGLRGFRPGGCCSGEDELLGGSVGCGADEEVVEAEAGQKLGEHCARCAGAVDAEDAMVAGRAVDLHSGLSGDGLQDLQERGILRLDGELTLDESDAGCGRRLVCEGNGRLRGGGLLWDGRGWLLRLRSACRSGP